MQIAKEPAISRSVTRFGGASPDLTSRFYTQLIPAKNNEVVTQVREHLTASNLVISRGRYDHLFSQDTQWVFEEPHQILRVKHQKQTDIPDVFSKGTNLTTLESNLYGGNAYIGIKESGEPYCLVGERVVNTSGSSRQEGMEKIASDLELSSTKNMVVIPQQSIWYLNDIDTFIRPLSGNTVLVYDPETTRQFLRDNNIQRVTAIAGSDSTASHSFQNIQKLLNSKGFNVIKAPGLFHYEGRTVTGQTTAFDVSLLNGLVRKNPFTGKLVYLTMDSAKPDLKMAFEAWLKQNCPEIEQVIFVDGGPPCHSFQTFPNRMIQIFNEEKGGLHCMFGEVINGGLWKQVNQKEQQIS